MRASNRGSGFMIRQRRLSSFFPFMLPVAALFLAGCVQTRQTVWLNPDGTGKFEVSADMPSPGLFMGGEMDEEQLARQARDQVAGFVRRAQGIDAWSDVSWAVTEENRVTFRATAYFRDIEEVEVPNLNLVKFSFLPGEDGERVLLLSFDEDKDEPVPDETAEPLTEEQIARRVRQEKAQFQQARMMLSGFMSDFRVEGIFHLPGAVSSAHNLEKIGERIYGVTIRGDRLLEVLDEMAADDDFWRRQVVAGRDGMEDGPFGDEVFTEKFFGQKGPVRALVSAPMEPLFDYEAEVAAAREGMEALEERLGAGAEKSPFALEMPTEPSAPPVEPREPEVPPAGVEGVEELPATWSRATPSGDEKGWSIEQPLAEVPATPLSGSLFGRDFELGEATIGNALKFESGEKKGGRPESVLTVFQVGLDEVAAGRTWVVTPRTRDATPYIHLDFTRGEDDLPGTLMFTEQYSMRLVIDSVSEQFVEGRIHISLPDYRKSHLLGAFRASVVR